MQSRSISNQPTADQLVDYYNNLETVTNILDLSASSYGEVWLESAISKRTSNLSNEVVNRTITYVSQRIVTDTQAKIDKQIEKLEQLAKDHPNNQEIQNAINNLRDAKNSVTVDNITNAKAMENAIGTLDNYGSQSAYNKLKQDAENPPAEVNKDGLRSDVAEADKVKGDYNYYNATNKDAYDKALEAAQKVIDNPAATQQEVNDAKTALAAAKTALNGSATDKATLQKDVEDSSITKADSKYYNASQDKKQAYDEALAQATKLLNDKNASQKAVDEAVANLEKAKAELNGEPNFIGGDCTPSEPSTPSTETLAEKTTEKILMHASYLYDNKGIKLDKPTVKSYVTVVVAENPVTINGIKYYKVAGKDEYIKAGNIDGTLRVITHNSYIYNNKGKATRNKGIKRLVKKTRIVRTYGALINIKGHMMYRIAKNRYIKARNFEGTLRRLSHNSFVYDENGKATRNKGIRRLLKKSRVVRTFDAPVKINGHMMYRVDNGYVKVKNFK
ncbi:hypothetical protein CYJ81_01930 [Lactobacillus crispatus]|uniref:SLAP domain-containing protein n=2 Tax=Lactobacillus crispatus TaxID=47770 RepID=UPI000C79EE84|nr:SLAP domain-containing protein [Lactobacillus crispatus]MDK7319607.1 SLAP domain-containing protein [Lactobacillus crispatus]MDK8271924.1 SLAP domain-containing protein [Lactobacillus crispatus]MDK8568109.1 SLAP domain-containing protein [Lactobacillus crispatus]PLT13768.1 hypothetical protein CYJ81_01930 [Lactobacillus crispatus]